MVVQEVLSRGLAGPGTLNCAMAHHPESSRSGRSDTVWCTRYHMAAAWPAAYRKCLSQCTFLLSLSRGLPRRRPVFLGWCSGLVIGHLAYVPRYSGLYQLRHCASRYVLGLEGFGVDCEVMRLGRRLALRRSGPNGSCVNRERGHWVLVCPIVLVYSFLHTAQDIALTMFVQL